MIKKNINMKNFFLSIIIPCFNEIQTIEEILKQIKKCKFPFSYEIIIVDDGSSDGTTEFLRKIKDNSIKTVFKQKNSGKGSAIIKGLDYTKGNYIIIQDADLEYDPNDIKKMIIPIFENESEVVYGSRFVNSSKRRVLYFWNYVANKFLTFLINIFTNMNFSDTQTCYKLIKKEIFESLKLTEKGFGIESEITMKISKLNLNVYEVGISYSGRKFEEGKKIRFKDGLRALFVILKFIFK